MAKKIIVGDLWDQKGFKVISTNLGGIHGRGLAQQAKQKGYINPQNIDFDTSPKNSDVITLAVKGNAPETAKIKGRAFSESTTGGNVKLLDQEINKLINFARNNPSKRINLPMVGLGFGEGDPKVIKPILERASKEPNIFLISKDEATAKKYSSTFKPGIRSDKTANKKMITVSNAVNNLKEKQKISTKNNKGIWFQGPSGGITDPKAFKKGLTKKYREARATFGPDIKVLYRGMTKGKKASQADQLIKEWGSEGYRKFLPPKKLHKDPKINKLYNKKYGDLLFQTDKKGKPIIMKDPINISAIEIPKESDKDFVDKQLKRWKDNKKLVNQFSFNVKGEVVYPGKVTKPHFDKFQDLEKKHGTGKRTKVVDEYLDYGETLDPEKRLHAMQVLEDKEANWKKIATNKDKSIFTDIQNQRMKSLKGDTPFPLKGYETFSLDPDAKQIDPDSKKQFIDSEGIGSDIGDSNVSKETLIKKFNIKHLKLNVVDPKDARNRKLKPKKYQNLSKDNLIKALGRIQTSDTIKGTDKILVDKDGIARRETKVISKQNFRKLVVNEKGIVKHITDPDKLVRSYDLAEIETKDVSGSGEKIDQLTVHDPERSPKVSKALKDKVGEGFDKDDIAIKKETEAFKSLKKFRRLKNKEKAKDAELKYRVEHAKIGDIHADQSDTVFDVTAHTDKVAKEEQLKNARIKTEVIESGKPTSKHIIFKEAKGGIQNPLKSQTKRDIVKNQIAEQKKSRVKGSYEFEGFYKTQPEGNIKITSQKVLKNKKPDYVKKVIEVGDGPKHPFAFFRSLVGRSAAQLGIDKASSSTNKEYTSYSKVYDKPSNTIVKPKPKTVNVTSAVKISKKIRLTPNKIENNLAKKAANEKIRKTLSANEARLISDKIKNKMEPKTDKKVVKTKKSTFGKVKYLSRFLAVLPPVAALYSLYEKKAVAKPTDKDKVITPANLVKETASVLLDSKRVFSGYGEKPGYINMLGIGGEYDRKGLLKHSKRIRNKPIPDAGGPNTPYAKFMNWRKKNQEITKQIKY